MACRAIEKQLYGYRYVRIFYLSLLGIAAKQQLGLGVHNCVRDYVYCFDGKHDQSASSRSVG